MPEAEAVDRLVELIQKKANGFNRERVPENKTPTLTRSTFPRRRLPRGPHPHGKAATRHLLRETSAPPKPLKEDGTRHRSGRNHSHELFAELYAASPMTTTAPKKAKRRNRRPDAEFA